MEVCVDSVESAEAAARGGASRLELCSALTLGGLTPSIGLLKEVKKKVGIEIFVMIRPRPGDDYCYREDELAVMERDIESLGRTGADGFVLGCLTQNGVVDEAACLRLTKSIKPGTPLTFHRAFDMVYNPAEALETIIQLGFRRILTSGQEPTALLGVDTIKRLVDKSKGRIEIMPGGGVTPETLPTILDRTGVREFHGSAKIPKTIPLPPNSSAIHQTDPATQHFVTDENKVRAMVRICNRFIRRRSFQP